MHPRINSRLSESPLYRAAADRARKHSRLATVAAAGAVVGVLGAAVSTVGAAPWTQALDNAAKTIQGDSPTTPGQQGAFLFTAITGEKTVSKPAVSAQLDSVSSPAKAGGTAAVAAAKAQPAQHQAAADPSNQATEPAQPVRQLLAKAQAVKPQAVKAQAVKAQAVKAQAVKAQAVKAQAAKPQAPAAPAKPYTIYDSITPSTIPAGQPAAVYANGDYAAFPNQLSGHSSVLWIDTNGSDPSANALDVEPGDATPAQAAQWVKERLTEYPHATAIVYTMLSDWQQVKQDVATLPASMQSQVRYWIADPTGVEHMVPGASATQWYWGTNYDITTANPGF